MYNGESIDFAVNDLISRAENELRKTAFREDSEDIKTVSWAKEHAWTLVKSLAEASEVACLVLVCHTT